MASMENLINQYYNSIMRSSNRYEETRKILNEIDNLVYEGTNSKISIEHKIIIIKGLKNKISPYEYKQFSNQDYLNLISVVLAQLEQQNQSSSSNDKE